MTALAISPIPTGFAVQPRLGEVLAYHPVLCGRCGNRPGHPLARSCTDTNCELRANDNRSHGLADTGRAKRHHA